MHAELVLVGGDHPVPGEVRVEWKIPKKNKYDEQCLELYLGSLAGLGRLVTLLACCSGLFPTPLIVLITCTSGSLLTRNKI